jgi:hypothetical protein
MDIKINSKKYPRLEVFRLLDMMNEIIKKEKYDIILNADNNDWIQIFKEDGKISIAKKENETVYQIYTLSPNIEVQKIISNYYYNQKTPIPQVWDNQKQSNENNGKINKIVAITFFVLLAISFVSVKLVNNLKLAMISLFFESIIFLYFGLKNIKENKYEARPYLMVVISIVLFVWSSRNLIKYYF